MYIIETGKLSPRTVQPLSKVEGDILNTMVCAVFHVVPPVGHTSAGYIRIL